MGKRGLTLTCCVIIAFVVICFVGITKSNAITYQGMFPENQQKSMGLHKLTKSEKMALWKRVKQLMRDSYALGRGEALSRPAAEKKTTVPNVNFKNLEGCIIVADDGQYLGLITRARFDVKSILNESGSYGSNSSPTSIFNDLSRYGSNLSSLSPFNNSATTPPKIYKGKTFVGYLTTNTFKTPAINPHALIDWLKSQYKKTG